VRLEATTLRTALLSALLVLAVPATSLAGPVRFKTPGLASPALELPAHDSLLLVFDGWSAESLEVASMGGWRGADLGDRGGTTFGLAWTGPDERKIVTNAANAGTLPLRVEVHVGDPAVKEEWDTEKRDKAQYGPVVIKDTAYMLTRTVDLRVDVVVRGSDGETAQSTSFSAQAKQSGGWESSEDSARSHAPSADVIATPLIDDLASELVGFLGQLVVTAQPRAFALEKNKTCKKETAGCLEAFDLLKKSEDLVGAYEAMAAIEGGDAWISYNAAVLAAALRRYDEARGHVEAAKALEDHNRFDKLLVYIEDWEAADQALVEQGYPLESPK